jgi:hypothetical protein
MSNFTVVDISGSADLRRFLKSLERNCTADCCKAAAFEVNTENIKQWRDNEATNCDAIIYQELFDLKQLDLENYNFVKLNIRSLESDWSSHEFCEFVDLLLNKLHKVICK